MSDLTIFLQIFYIFYKKFVLYIIDLKVIIEKALIHYFNVH